MSQTLLSLPLAALLCVAACAALIGCGSSSRKGAGSSTKASAATPGHVGIQAPSAGLVDAALAQIKSPNQVIVRIGKTQITKRELYHWMSIGPAGRREVPEPPEFNTCIINLRKTEQTSAGGEGRAANQLKGVCAERFSEELQSGLGTLVNNAWLFGELAEAGVAIDQRELQSAYRQGLAQVAKSPGGLAGLLKSSGHTVADLKYELSATQASDKLYAMIAAKTPKPTPALLADYYRRHKSDFLLPEQRDIYILHTKSKASALRAKTEIKAGKSFAEVVKSVGTSQPLGAKEGRDRTLTRTSYAQRNLIDAIFSARPKVLSGPFQLRGEGKHFVALGFYVYEVLRKIPARQLSLAQAKAQIEQLLPQELQNSTRKDFIAAYRAKWKARTDCAPGYVIENCRQFKGKAHRTPDPYLL
jgi:foldase protein PrsA